MQKLSVEQVEKLIDMVKEKPAMYDKKEKLYKNTDWRDSVWKKIAEEIEADEKDCRTAWKSLRDQFLKCINEMKGRSGQEATDGVKKKYKYFKNLLFLKGSCEPRKTSSNFDTEDNIFEKNENANDTFWSDTEDMNLQEVHQITDEPSSFDASSLMSPPSNLPLRTVAVEGTSTRLNEASASTAAAGPSSSSGAIPKRRRTVSSGSDSSEQYSEFLNELLEKTSERELDGMDNFFLGISSTIKNYKLTASEIAHLQCKIMLFVTEELEKIKIG